MDHRYGKAKWGPHGTRVRTSDANWRKPLAWDRAAAKSGERHRVFCASLADVFEDWKGPIVNAKKEQLFSGPNIVNATAGELHAAKGMGAGARATTMGDQRADLFRLIDATPNLDWLLLTKRPENVRRMWPAAGTGKDPGAEDYLLRDNVWIGTSISDQATASGAVPRLLECRDLCPVLFLSAEPLVGPVSLRTGVYSSLVDGEHQGTTLDGIDWLIVGGESGQGRRPMELEWARFLRDQCQASGVQFFMKQIDKVQEIPADLMVRQFPAVRTAAAV